MSLNTVPFNPFPPSSDQKGSGGGSYVLPAATAETLGGVKVGDNLTVEEDGTLNAADPYTLPIAEDDTLGGVKVGSGLSINSETGVLSADRQIMDYSTTEQATGQKWIDGKEIYCRTIYSATSLTPGQDWTLLDDTVSYDTLINANIVLKGNGGDVNDGNSISHADGQTASPRFLVRKDHKLYYFMESSTSWTYEYFLTLYYTKTAAEE